ncbi:transposase [Limosilactobacillus mucosae]|uniref:Transposase n=1 Tax=Limosilactobacillus mucosae LM1 TaxID=1130798 RepID=A0A0D4CKR7_LIMMU|nr:MULTISPECIES: transposase [Lactobacillaceae]AJT50486.1 hypothetical protein LBLM1_05125 [Limosilactobacillus mucosae LM1]MCI6052840.1 transposase [Limosilactobacillus mucosae]MDD7321806.1 transposase [Limosilactobacillus mucosae]MDF9443977.1 transposase [Limosilactobacillus mucosae]MDY5412728.1 transposase [Limosilactobacillus mucosae]
MNRYSPELKREIINEYLTRKDEISISELSRQHNIDPRRVSDWIRDYRLRGKIVSQQGKHRFSTEFA